MGKLQTVFDYTSTQGCCRQSGLEYLPLMVYSIPSGVKGDSDFISSLARTSAISALHPSTPVHHISINVCHECEFSEQGWVYHENRHLLFVGKMGEDICQTLLPNVTPLNQDRC